MAMTSSGSTTSHLPRPPCPSASFLRGQRQRDLSPKQGESAGSQGPAGRILGHILVCARPRVFCSRAPRESPPWLGDGRHRPAGGVGPSSWCPVCKAVSGSHHPGLHTQLGALWPCRLVENLWVITNLLGTCRGGWSLLNTQQCEVTQSACCTGGRRARAQEGSTERALDRVSRSRVLALGPPAPRCSEVRGRPCSLQETTGWISLGHLARPPKAYGDPHIPTHVLLMPSK